MRNEKIFDSLAWRVHRWGLRPNHFTFMQAPVYAAMAFVGYGIPDEPNLIYAFGTLQVLVVVLDGADGILARRTGTATRQGHLLDSLFDIIGIGITLWVVMHVHSELTGWAFGLLLVNFLVYIQNEIQGTKAVTYTRGPVSLGLWFQVLAPDASLWGQPQFVFVGLLLPLMLGLILIFTRVEWRKRTWNWYQFLTAGQRREYKSTPRPERAGLPSPAPRRDGSPASDDPAAPGVDPEPEHGPKASSPSRRPD